MVNTTPERCYCSGYSSDPSSRCIYTGNWIGRHYVPMHLPPGAPPTPAQLQLAAQAAYEEACALNGLLKPPPLQPDAAALLKQSEETRRRSRTAT